MKTSNQRSPSSNNSIHEFSSAYITKSEKYSLMYYQGGGKNIPQTDLPSYLRDFYQNEKAYEVLDTLLYPGIENEKVRIQQEGRTLSFDMLDNMPEILKIYQNLYSAICKYTLEKKQSDDLHVYRKDRYNSWSYLEKRENPSFMSASMSPKVDPFYFENKYQILLLEMDMPADIEHIDLNEVLGKDSIYPNEKEILFPPFLYFSHSKLSLTGEEKKYRDINGQEAKFKYKLMLHGSSIHPESEDKCFENTQCMAQLYSEIIALEETENAKQVWQMIGKEKQPLNSVATAKYSTWKEKISQYLKLLYARIKREVSYNTTINQSAFVRLQEDVLKYQEEVDEKRKKYKKRFERYMVALCILSPLCLMTMSFGFVEDECISMNAHVISIVLNTIVIILAGIAKSLAFDKKWQQRTDIYLRLDELAWALGHEIDCNKENYKKYLELFQDIISKDDQKCRENTAFTVEYFQSQYKTVFKEEGNN